MSRAVHRVLSTLSAAVLLLAAGCADAGAPTAVEAPSPEGALFQSSGNGPDLERLARFTQRPSITIAWAKAWIGPQGGRLDFHGFAIDVPPGAVDKVTMFSVRLPVDPWGSGHVVAEFGPHGKTFARPISIELPRKGTTLDGEEGSTILWWNPDASAWEDMGATVTADGERLRTETPHFSTFGAAAAFSDGVVLSGG